MSRLAQSIIGISLALTLAACVSEPETRPVVRSVPDNFSTLMPPQNLLRDDTVAAATHDRNQSRLAYVGVWAPNGDACAMMDQTDFDGFAVITPDSLRRPGETCSFEPGQPSNASLRVDATCKQGKKTIRRTLGFDMPSNQQLNLLTAPDAPGVTLVRCHLQK